MTGAALDWYLDQSIWLLSRSCKSILLTGGCWSRSASSACSLQWLVVLTMMRWVNGFLPEAVKKLSMSAFWMPFTNNRDFKANPRLLVSAEGMYYKDVDGNQVLDGTAGDRDEAITEAGNLLVATGNVDAGYVDSMHERERSVSTYMGNLLAIPHGTNDAKAMIARSSISVVRYPNGIEWNGNPVRFVIGIAGAGNDHLALLGQIAEVFLDESRIAELEAATTAAQIRDAFGKVNG